MTRHTHTLAASDPELSQACATAQTAISTYDCRGKKDHKLYSLVVDFYTNTMVWAGLPFGNLRAVDEEEPDRCAKACALVRRRAHDSNCSRSASVNTNTAFGRPVLGIPEHYTYLQTELTTQDTRSLLKNTDTPAAAHPRHLAPPTTLTCQRHATLVARGPRHWRLHHIERIAHSSTDS